jgi:basic membrane protein A
MRIKRRWFGIASTFVLAVTLSSLLATSVFASGSHSTASSAKNANQLTVAMITNQTAGDDATVDGMIQGMAKGAKALGYTKTKFIPVLDPNQYEPTLRQLAQQGYPLIIGAVQGLGPAFDAVAKSFPNTKFAIFFAVPHVKNVAGYFAPQQEMGYPGGIAAGLVTKTNKLAYVLGIEHPLIRDAEAGFIAGALSVNPKIKVYDNVPNTLTDPAVGKEVATSLFSKGVDVIASLSVHTSLGIYQDARQLRNSGKNVWVVSNDAQHISKYAGNASLVSSVFLLQNAVYQIMNDFKAGKFTGGIHHMTLKNKEVGIFQWGPRVPKSVIARVLTAQQKVFSGYKVPDHTWIAKYVKQGVLIKG